MPSTGQSLHNAMGSIGMDYVSCLMTKPTKWSVRPAKTQISLGIRLVWSESLQCAQWVAMFLHADNEDSDQTGRMPRLIWVLSGGQRSFCCFCHEAAFVISELCYKETVSQCNYRIREPNCIHVTSKSCYVCNEFINVIKGLPCSLKAELHLLTTSDWQFLN